MIRFRLLFNKDAETAWLNSMAQDGWAMTGFFAGFYTFDSCEKGAYLYQVDFTDRLWSVTSDYREFMKEMGAEIVTNWGFWTVLRKPASEGPFELYTDVDSQIEHYTKIKRMFKTATIIEVICFYIELLVAAYGAYCGSYIGYIFALLLGPLVLGVFNATLKTADIIEELKERKTGISSGKKGKTISPLFLAGLLCNSFALMTGHPAARSLVYLQHSLQILSIILIAAGIYTTIRRSKY